MPETQSSIQNSKNLLDQSGFFTVDLGGPGYLRWFQRKRSIITFTTKKGQSYSFEGY